MSKSVAKQLKDFIDFADERCHHWPSWWLRDEVLQVYVRRGHRFIMGERLTTLDVVNITVEPRFRKRGQWTRFLAGALELNPWDGIFIENVLNDHLILSLRKKAGWIELNDSGLSPCFFKHKRQ